MSPRDRRSVASGEKTALDFTAGSRRPEAVRPLPTRRILWPAGCATGGPAHGGVLPVSAEPCGGLKPGRVSHPGWSLCQAPVRRQAHARCPGSLCALPRGVAEGCGSPSPVSRTALGCWFPH